MAANKLCLNDAKMEFLTLCTPWHHSSVEVSSLRVGLSQVNTACPHHAQSWCHHGQHAQHRGTCPAPLPDFRCLELKNIADIRQIITQDTAEKLVHAFITSWLDCCNALLYGLPATSLQKLARAEPGSPCMYSLGPLL